MDRRKGMWSKHVPDALLDEIYQNYSSEDQRLHACADFYVNFNPKSSWMLLCCELWIKKEVTAAGKANTFIPKTGK